MTIWITTNGRPSNGAKALAQQPGFKRCLTGKGLKPDDVLVNWGSTKDIKLAKQCGRVMNYVMPVSMAANKLECFQALLKGEVKTVEWTLDKAKAQEWLDKEYTVVARTILTGHSGNGIIIVEKGEELPDAPLYTKYIYKEKEYRVHVVGDGVVDTQRKIKDPKQEVKTWKVRSHANGFIYARNGITPDAARDELAVAAVKAVGLHFGAVDIIQDKKGTYYVLEINTAPGLEGQTVELYAQAFRDWEQANGPAAAQA